jgi:hypothetical protein
MRSLGQVRKNQNPGKEKREKSKGATEIRRPITIALLQNCTYKCTAEMDLIR